MGPKGAILIIVMNPLPIEPLTYGYLQAIERPIFRSGARCDAWLRYDPILHRS